MCRDEADGYDVVWNGEMDRKGETFSLTGDYQQTPQGSKKERWKKKADRDIGARWSSTFEKAKREASR